MQTTIDLNEDILAQAQTLALRESTTLNRLIEDALATRLQTSLPRQRPVLPIFHGSGGLTDAVTDSLTHRALLDAADETASP